MEIEDVDSSLPPLVDPKAYSSPCAQFCHWQVRSGYKHHFREEVVRRSSRNGEFQNRSIFVVVAFVLHFDEIIHTDHN
jgi:hypothetical protein